MAETIQDGIILYRSGRYTDALTVFLSLPAPDIHTEGEDAVSFELAYYIGLSYARLERYDEAVLYLEQVVTGGSIPDRVNQCRFVLAVIYGITGRSRLADFELQQLLEADYKKAEVYAALAYVEWNNKKTSKTVEHYEKALEINPNNSTALNGLGYVLACIGKDLTRALTLCKRALDMRPDSPACLDSLGWVYYKMGLLGEAQTYIKRAKDRAQGNPEIEEHYNSIFNTTAADA